MSITVNTNMSSLICQRSLSKATLGMNTALERMSTGLRINSAKDDAAGSAISSKMDYKLSSYGVAQSNAQMGQSMIDTASGSLSVMNNMLQRMRDLAEQASNGTYGSDERKAMQAEIDALTDEIYRIKNTTEFNGKKVLGEEEKVVVPPPPPPVPIDYELKNIDVNALTAAEWNSTYKGKTLGISSAEELAKIATIVNDKNFDTSGTTFALTADINLDDLGDIDGNGSNWIAIGDKSRKFKGIFDGHDFVISNLKINKPTQDYQGLFGYTEIAEIKNTGLENVEVTGNNYTGGLLGYNWASSVIDSYVTGDVTGSNVIGGLVGSNYYNSVIQNSYATGNVKGDIYIGGLLGQNNSSYVTNSYSTSTVVGNSSTGAFMGVYNSGTLTNNRYDSTINPGMKAVGLALDNPSVDQIKDERITPPVPPGPQPESPVCKVNLQVGIQSDYNSVLSLDTGFKLGEFEVNLTTEDGARLALGQIDDMLAKINSKSLDLGAASNRLTSILEFQSVQMTSLTSANSLIKDADIAKESASYIKNQILQQTTSTLLSTANQNPSIALSLI